MIDEKILRKFGAVEKRLEKGEILFLEGNEAFFYYQILSGVIKMNNYNENGREMIQGLFTKGQSFGEPALLGNFPFPANAEAVEKAHLICLEKSLFFEMLKKCPEISIQLLEVISKRLQFKAMIAKEISGYEAEHRILTLLRYLKKNSKQEKEFCVNMTRQTIASLIGLRVETVIRSVNELKQKGSLKIKGRKIYI
ncbi:MAG: Crp/Fnr family transcriptional regulator [Lewinellaceae bacterium]|nr:Crp/Fnr family transcriptional regulator [Lewinellaceae bacterium]